ncbi:VolA/Pla-1 family phospholipase [Idiomarina xiamenensis]|uniref:Alpha/beta hydrolase n=1 Tax=Idiomarina xiamenensis 10-D-4 TaxID=740709 RepID=K2JK77_9GAMM|nr:VolA/Pla-1 family phospholipase [Idiomarina xiamenensis]EKE83866.1 alpha/beta hydrolase [Idiomarina xiamenensis 10-D-4]
MKKLLLPLAIGSALGLVGCGSGDEAPLTDEEVTIAATRAVFDPTNSVIPVPSNILLSGTTDLTLNIPVDDPDDSADPQVAINGLDGWGTHSTLTFSFSLPTDKSGNQVTVDANSVTQAGAVRVFSAVQGGSSVSSECAAASPAAVCAITGELTYGEDFVVSATGANGLAVVPLRPLQPKTGYVVALTNQIQDSLGRDVVPSQTYNLMKRPVDESPVSGDASAQNLQALINSYEGAMAAFGVDTDTVIMSSNFTTQSVGDVLGVIKARYAQQYSGTGTPALQAMNTGITVADALVNAGRLPNDPSNPAYAVASTAKLYGGQVTLNYYLGSPSAENPTAPLNRRWRAACDSPVTVLGAIQAGELDPGSVGVDPSNPDTYNPANNCIDIGIDSERNLTKVNPIPAKQSDKVVPARVTIPDLATVNAVRQAQGLEPFAAAPANGWPVVIFQHGITANKDSLLPIAGMLALNGFAAVAIDHPLHGERGFDVDQDGTDDINASTVSVTNYMNLSNLLVTRDNLRQSIADLLGLRVSLNGFVANDGETLDVSRVYFVGHSLGAIAGTGFTALTNSALPDAFPAQANGLFAVRASTLGMPGGSIANFLLASPSFSTTIKSQLLYAASAEFKATADNAAAAQGIAPGTPAFATLLENVYPQFIGALSDSQLAQINATFEQFAFAAQTVVDSADPVNYAATIRANETPIHLIEVVGNGSEGSADQVIPNSVENKPLAGTEPLIRLLQLAAVSSTTAGADGATVSGAVRFVEGSHSSLVDPTASAAATQEMQTEIGAWFASGATVLPITNESVVKQ